MRHPIFTTEQPYGFCTGFSTAATLDILDLREADEDTQDVVRFVTLYAPNAFTGPAGVGAGTIQLASEQDDTTVVFKTIAPVGTPILDRFPVRGPVSLQVTDFEPTRLFGWFEFEDPSYDRVIRPATYGDQVSPFTTTVLSQSGSTTGSLCSVPDGLWNVSLYFSTTGAHGTQPRFTYTPDDLTASESADLSTKTQMRFTVSAATIGFRTVCEGVPVVGPGVITLTTGAAAPASVAYGYLSQVG